MSEMGEVGSIIFLVFVLLVFAKVLGGLFEKMKLPALVGQIIAGIVFINLVLIFPEIGEFIGFDAESFLDIHNSESHFLHIMGEIGIIFLLFTVGLHTKFSDLKKVGKVASYVAILGIIVPFAGGMLFFFGGAVTWQVALLLGAALFGMSTAITVECLRNLDAMNSTEAKIIISASVIDDILCLMLLAIFSGILAPGEKDMTAIAINTITVILFVIMMFWGISKAKYFADRRRKTLIGIKKVGNRISGGDIIVGGTPADYHKTEPMTQLNALGLAVIVCLGLATLSTTIGLVGIIGAFLAGMLFAEFKDTIPCEQNFNVLTYFMLPFFFIWVGMLVDYREISMSIVPLLAAIVVVAILTKYIGGYIGSRMGHLSKESANLIGVSMIPRGEVGIIVATIGLSTGLFEREMFTTILLMAIITSIITPPLVQHTWKKMAKKKESAETIDNV